MFVARSFCVVVWRAGWTAQHQAATTDPQAQFPLSICLIQQQLRGRSAAVIGGRATGKPAWNLRSPILCSMEVPLERSLCARRFNTRRDTRVIENLRICDYYSVYTNIETSKTNTFRD